MHHAVGMDIFQCVQNANGDADGPVLRNLALIQNIAQQPAFAPLHDHVNAGALLIAKNAHHLGMVQFFANSRLPLKAVEEDGVGFQVGMRNLQGDYAVIAQVDGAVDRGHAAARDRRLNAVEIDLRTSFQAVVVTHAAACSE